MIWADDRENNDYGVLKIIKYEFLDNKIKPDSNIAKGYYQEN